MGRGCGCGMIYRAGAAFLVLVVVVLVAPLVGPTTLDWAKAWAGEGPDGAILWTVRVPRVWMAALAGGALALAGLLFQALLRDALATPYTLGISSGASLGAVIAICTGMTQVWGPAFLGAACALGLVLGIASEGRRMSSFTLLLAGVTVNSMAMALILFLQSFTTFGQAIVVARWLMGSVDVVETRTLWILSVVVLAGFAWMVRRAGDWNLLAVGEDWAAARGVSVQRTLLAGYLAGSLLTAAVTTFTGPIGFVGLIVPHALRMRLGADHRVLAPCSLFAGAAFLVVCDAAARTAMAPAEVPVGVITALCGGPFFIWLLRTRKRSLSL
jgi:iron complex transport system permease protein